MLEKKLQKLFRKKSFWRVMKTIEYFQEREVENFDYPLSVFFKKLTQEGHYNLFYRNKEDLQEMGIIDLYKKGENTKKTKYIRLTDEGRRFLFLLNYINDLFFPEKKSSERKSIGDLIEV